MHHDIDSGEKDSSQQLLPEIADYAEVNPNTMSTFLKERELSSPAPYATTTLVSNSSSRNVNIIRIIERSDGGTRDTCRNAIDIDLFSFADETQFRRYGLRISQHLSRSKRVLRRWL